MVFILKTIQPPSSASAPDDEADEEATVSLRLFIEYQ
jgi:hypothetical protein